MISLFSSKKLYAFFCIPFEFVSICKEKIFFMILALLFSICWKKSYNIPANAGVVTLITHFGFYRNGKYQVNISNSETNRLFVLIGTFQNINSYSRSILNSFDACNGTYVDYLHKVPVIAGQASFSGTIKEKGMYYTMVSPCDGNSGGFTLSLQYSNPNSFLSYDVSPCLITTPIIAALSGLILGIWVINWMRNFSLKNSLHLYFTIGLMLTFSYNALMSFEYYTMNRKDGDSPLYVMRKIFRVLQESSLIFAMLLASDGWCIIHHNMPYWKIALAFLLSGCVTVSCAVADFVELTNLLYLVVFLILGISSGIYLYIMLKNTQIGYDYVKAHLYVIAESGIDPKTTPIYKKYRLYKAISWEMPFYFILLFFRIMFSFYLTFPFWTIQLAYDVIILTLITVISFTFRMRKETRDGYMMIGDEDQEPRIFDRADITALEIETNENQHPYEEGMPLPAQPHILDKKKKSKHKGKKHKDEDAQEREKELIDNNEFI